MPRSHRIEYPRALYHVINRGRNKSNIFHTPSDFELFLKIIGESNTKFEAIIHSYCLMDNHYHLLIETPNANLSKIMHFISQKYVMRYNYFKECDGSLFKGRYKAILVEKDTYLVELNRYIHRNPINLVDNLRDYKWSSYPSYLGISNSPSWLNMQDTLKILGSDRGSINVEKYSNFIELDRDYELYQGYKRIPSIIGDRDFKNKIIKDYKT